MTDKLWMTVWSGGYEAPSYQLHPTLEDAINTATAWADDADEDEGDWVDVLELNVDQRTIRRLTLTL